MSKPPGMRGLLWQPTPKPIATREPTAAMALALAPPGRSSATFWLFRTASTASTPTTKTVLSLVTASAFGWEPVINTDDLDTGAFSSAGSFFFPASHQSVKKAGTYVKPLPSTSRTRSSYPAVKTLPSGVPMSPETRFVCPWPASGAASPVGA